jgi:hypothetical protein
VAKAASWTGSKRWAEVEQMPGHQREAREQALAGKLKRLRVRKCARPTDPTSSGPRVVRRPSAYEVEGELLWSRDRVIHTSWPLDTATRCPRG